MQKKNVVLYGIFIFSSLLAALVLSLVSKTSIFSLDAWNTTWNDETGYNRTIQIMRTIGTPMGVASYNEQPASSLTLAYGPWNVCTYLPYLLFSFLTGTSSHNFMYYCNVLMIIAANLIFVRLVKPDRKQTVWLIVLAVTSLVYQRYVWSGMSEASNIAMALISLACAIWLFSERERSKKKEWIVLSIVTLLVCFYGVIRPYNLVFLMIPLWYVIRRDTGSKVVKGVRIFLILAFTLLALAVYFYLGQRYGIKYFSNTSPRSALIEMIKLAAGGHIWQCCQQILSANADAVRTVAEKMKAGSIIGIVTIEWFVETLILLGLFLKDIVGKRKRISVETAPGNDSGRLMAAPKERSTLCVIYIIAGILIYEATIVLYSPDQLHRMMLSMTVVSGVLICLYGNYSRYFVRGIGIALLAVGLCLHPATYQLPQQDDSLNASMDAGIREELKEAMPMGEDPWDNTIAALPEGSHMYLKFCYPEYLNTSCCLHDYLQAAIEEDTLLCRYIYLSDESDLATLCEEKYEVIWSGYGYTIYLNAESEG